MPSKEVVWSTPKAVLNGFDAPGAEAGDVVMVNGEAFVRHSVCVEIAERLESKSEWPDIRIGAGIIKRELLALTPPKPNLTK